MKINLENTYFPKPFLNKLSDDFIQNEFNLDVKILSHDTMVNKAEIEVIAYTNNQAIIRMISNLQVSLALHIEQRTQRIMKLISFGTTKLNLDLNDFAVKDSIEFILVVFCNDDFEFAEMNHLNPAYTQMSSSIQYKKHEIIGLSNNKFIDLIDNNDAKGIISLLKGNPNEFEEPYKISLNNEVIQIKMRADLFDIYSREVQTERHLIKTLYTTIVYPAVLSAINELYNNYDIYRDLLWAKVISSRISQKEKQEPEMVFIIDNFDINKSVEQSHFILGSLFQDSMNDLLGLLNERGDE